VSIDRHERSGRRPFAAASALAILLAVSTLGLAAGQAGAVGCAAVQPAAAGWQRIAAPRVPTGPARLTGYAVSADASTLFATNGTVVERSADGGCGWAVVYTLSAAPTATPALVSAAARITSIVTGLTGAVYLVVTDAGHPHVIASSDSGSSWRDAETGIVGAAAAPTAAQLVAATSGSTLYLLTSGLDAALPLVGTQTGMDVLFTSTDSGGSWTARPLQPTLVSAGLPSGVRARQLAVVPGSDAALWLATSAGLASSSDGGATWTLADTGSSVPLGAVTVADPAGSSGATVAAFGAQSPVAFVSTRGGVGGSWSQWPAPGTVTAATSAPTGSQAYGATANGQLYVMDPANREFTRLWAGPPGLSDPKATVAPAALGSSTTSVLYACSCSTSASAAAIYLQRQSAAGPVGSPPPVPPGPPSNSNGGCNLGDTPMRARDWGQPAFDPPSRSVVLNVGQSVTVAEPVSLPPRRMAVNFLADMGQLSRYTWCPTKYAQIVVAAELARVRNLAVGLGEFGDYPGSTAGGFGSPGASSVVYSRVHPIGPPNAAYVAASAGESNATENGSPSGDGGGLAALYQAATGAGQTAFIPAGGQAGFDPSSYNVAVTTVLAHFNSPSNTVGYPGPTVDAVVAALRARQVHQVGIWVQNANKTPNRDPGAFRDSKAMALATGGVAGAATSCEVPGYFATVIPAGGPLVCPYTSPVDVTLADPQLGREILALLLAMRDVEPVRLRILSGGGPGIEVSPAVYKGLDLLTAHRLPASLRLTCAGSPGSRLVRLGVEAYGQVLATADVQLTCAAPAVPRPPAAPAILPPPLGPPAPQPLTNPAPNPAANVEVNPAPNPAQAPQAQAQAVGQAVVVPQPEVQPQLALQRVANEAQQNHAMSALRLGRADGLRTATHLVLVGGALVFAGGCALKRGAIRAWAWGAGPATRRELTR
jgi:hypothetical protein